MKLVKFLVVSEYADPGQYSQLPDDLTLVDNEQKCFAFDQDSGRFVELLSQKPREIWNVVLEPGFPTIPPQVFERYKSDVDSVLAKRRLKLFISPDRLMQGLREGDNAETLVTKCSGY